MRQRFRPLSPGRLSLAALLLVLGGCNDVNVTTVGAAQVSLSPPSTFVKVGETTRLSASVLSSDGQALSGRIIQWTSLDPDIASVDSSGLVLGLVAGNARIRASSEGATGTAQVTVTSGPAIMVAPAEVEFSAVRGGASPGDRTVAITNIGDGTLSGLSVSVSYPSGAPIGWLSANLVGSSAPATLVLGAVLGNLAIGTYEATVTINSPVASNAPLVLPVRLHVLAPEPAISLGATSIGFAAQQGGADPAQQQVAVTNAGGGTLSGLAVAVTYASGQPSGWLSATLGGTTAPTTITLRAATGSLSAGTYSASVRVSSPTAQNSPQTIAVTLTVGAAQPAIRATPASLTFTGTSPASQQIQITNSGGGTLSGLSVSVVYPGGQPSGWLGTSLSGTSAPATLTVSASAGALAPGSYTATIRITASGAANSPLDVPVTFTFTEAVPGVPANVSANAVSTSRIDVTWNAASGNVGEYRIERKTGTGGTWTQVATVNGGTTRFENTGLLENTTYFYRVRACSVAGCSAYSSEASATTPGVPGAPPSVTATAVSTTRIDVTWGAASGNVTEYRIERKTGAGGNWSQVTTVSGGTTRFENAQLLENTTYFYRVRACNSSGCSPYSVEASATTQSGPPSSPTTLLAEGVSTSAIALQWSHDGLIVTRFEVQRAPEASPTSFQDLANLSGSARTYTDGGLPAATTYVYRIRACGIVSCSAWSGTATATTLGGTGTPAVPGGLSATALSQTEVRVTWNSVTGHTAYRIRRQNAEGGKRTVTFVTSADATSYTDTGLSRNTEYEYAIQACNQSACSDYSSIVTVRTQ